MSKSIFEDVMYSELLASDGYRVDFAVLTTYSLDMHSLLSIPFAIGAVGELSDGDVKPHLLLQAVNNSAGRFALFCNAGNIKVPKNINKVYSLLEKCVTQISLGGESGFVNFHPKVWVIKESSLTGSEIRIRVVVTSRNLAASTDIDIVCELTGVVGNSVASNDAQEKHCPLKDFLLYLCGQAKDENTKTKIADICECIDKVERFDTGNSPFDDYDFYPMGINGYTGKDCLDLLKESTAVFVVSPFIDDYTLKDIQSKNRTLITRREYVTEEILDLFNGEVYAVKESMLDNDVQNVSVDIHEKLYYIENYNKYPGKYLLLGSTNATRNGFCRNVEFLLRLKYRKGTIQYSSFKKSLIYDDDEAKSSKQPPCLFEKVTAAVTAPAEKDSREAELRKAIASNVGANVTCENNGNYAIKVTFKNAHPGVSVYPLFREGLKRKVDYEILFKEIKIDELSEFYVFETTGTSSNGEKTGSIKRIVKIETEGIPVEDRESAILNSIISTPRDLIGYVEFMLTDSPDLYICENLMMDDLHKHSSQVVSGYNISLSLYEDLLRAAYYAPDKLGSIQTFLGKLSAARSACGNQQLNDVANKLSKMVDVFKKCSK